MEGTTTRQRSSVERERGETGGYERRNHRTSHTTTRLHIQHFTYICGSPPTYIGGIKNHHGFVSDVTTCDIAEFTVKYQLRKSTKTYITGSRCAAQTANFCKILYLTIFGVHPFPLSKQPFDYNSAEIRQLRLT